MTYRVVVTASAKQNLRSAYLWAAEQAPHTAAAWLARFEKELEKLAYFPERGQENTLVDEEIRQLILGTG
jgi:plasmid stabilization system protein ParE